MEREKAQQANYETINTDSSFEIEFDTNDMQSHLDEDKKQRIRRELMNLEW